MKIPLAAKTESCFYVHNMFQTPEGCVIMQQLSLSRPLATTRVLSLPDKPRTPRKVLLNLKKSTSLKPTTGPQPSTGTATRKRLTLPLRPIRGLPPRPFQLWPPAVQAAPRGRDLSCGAVAFASAAQAWFWTLGALAARHDGSRVSGVGQTSTGRSRINIRRPCEPDDVIRALDLLHRRGDITLAHARVLRRWGDRGFAPNAVHPGQEADALLWVQALERLEVLLRAKTIVAVVL